MAPKAGTLVQSALNEKAIPRNVCREALRLVPQRAPASVPVGQD
jgi:hypothetical protein